NNQQNQNRELSQINQQIAVIDSRFTEIDNSTEKLHQTISENNQEISEIKQKQEIETSQNHHILDVITQQLTKLDALTELDNLFTALVQPLQVENKLNLQPKPIMEETSKKIEEIKEISQINNLDSIENSLNKSWEKLDVLRGLNTLFNPLQIENESNLQPKDNYQETAETLELTPPKSLIDEKTGKLVFFNNLKTHKNKVLSVAFSPNGKLLASGSDDKIIILWDLATKKHSILEGHGEYSSSRGINSIAFSPDSQFLISGSDDKTIKLWDINLRLAIFTFIGHEKKVYAVAFSPLGKLIASGSKDKTVR
ncbi:MAG: WD40 repeat domain-containing protein, partial [Dolichospermum sp.]